MCIKDVRMGRAKYPFASASAFCDNTNPRQLFGGSANRAAVFVGQNVVDPTGLSNPILVRSGSATGPVLAMLNQYSPTAMLTVEVTGSAVRDPIWVTTDDTGGATVTGTDFTWTTDPEDA